MSKRGPLPARLSMEDFASLPADVMPAFEKLLRVLNPFLADTAVAIESITQTVTTGEAVTWEERPFVYVSPWTNYVTGFTQSSPVKVWRSSNGWVHVSGYAAHPGIPVDQDGILTMPSNCIPPVAHLFPVAAADGATRVVGIVELLTSGVLRYRTPPNGSTLLSLDTVWYKL